MSFWGGETIFETMTLFYLLLCDAGSFGRKVLEQFSARKRLFLQLALLVALTPFAMADTISVNFHVEGDSDSQADHELDGTETAGAPGFCASELEQYRGGFWGTNSTAQIFPATALSDDLGNTAVATLSTSVNSTRFVGYAASSAANANELNLAGHDDDLFNSYLALNGPSGDGSPSDAAVLQVSGLGAPYTVNGYSLVIYSETDRSPGGSGTRRSVFTVTPAGGLPLRFSRRTIPRQAHRTPFRALMC